MSKIRPGRIVKGFKRALTGEHTTSSGLRIETCGTCEHNKKGICGICGCVLKAKTKVFEEYCPDNRWHDVKVLERLGVAVVIKNPELLESFEINEDGISFTADYGEIKIGSPTKLDFLVVNDRSTFFDADIDLTEVRLKSSCGCTHVGSEIPKTLPDGEYASFSLSYDSEMLGDINQSARLLSTQGLFRIFIKGKVVR